MAASAGAEQQSEHRAQQQRLGGDSKAGSSRGAGVQRRLRVEAAVSQLECRRGVGTRVAAAVACRRVAGTAAAQAASAAAAAGRASAAERTGDCECNGSRLQRISAAFWRRSLCDKDCGGGCHEGASSGQVCNNYSNYYCMFGRGVRADSGALKWCRMPDVATADAKSSADSKVDRELSLIDRLIADARDAHAWHPRDRRSEGRSTSAAAAAGRRTRRRRGAHRGLRMRGFPG